MFNSIKRTTQNAFESMGNLKEPKMWSLSKGTVVQCAVAALASVAVMMGLRVRPLGIFFLFVFVFWFYRTQCNWRIVPPTNLKEKYEQVQEVLQDLRKNNPTMFCAITVSALGVLAIMGHLLSGSTVVLIGLVLAAIVSTKYNFKLQRISPADMEPEAWFERFTRKCIADIDDEFIPEVNNTNLFVLERASDTASLVTSPTENADEEENSDEIPSELLITDAIPEVNDKSTDEDDDDLAPTSLKDTDTMEFKKGHFKRDSSLETTSSSSEESLSLKRQGTTWPTIGAATLVGLLPQVISAASGNTKPTIKTNDVVPSSDESDFEIVDTDDF